MKKMTKLATLLLCVVMIISSLTACSIFSNRADDSGSSSGGGDPQPKTQTIIVYNGDTPTTYTVTLGEVAVIDVFTKPEYYFVGAYDSAEGGTKYFDGNGNSTMVWGAGNPDTYYTRFESIYNLSYSQIDQEEEPHAWANGGVWWSFTLSEDIVSAIKGNLDLYLTVKISFDGAVENKSNWGFNKAYITNLKSGGINHICFDKESEETKLPANSIYKTFSYTFKIQAKEFKNGTVYFYLSNSTIVTNTKYYVKNIVLDVSFYGNALEHSYGTPVYSWDGKQCTAERICSRDNTHVETETVTATYVKDTNATCTTAETGHYVVTFTNTAFTTQTTDVGSLTNGIALDHSYGDFVSNNNGTHTKTCLNDSSHTITENCSGGTATCVSLAVCEHCETEYGTYGEHNFSSVWTIGNGKHWHVCQNTGCQEISNENDHIYTNGVCVCGDEKVADIHIVSQVQWESAFDFENVTIKRYVVMEGQNISVGNYLLDGNDALFLMDSIQAPMTGYADFIRMNFDFSDCYNNAKYQEGRYYITYFDVYGDESYVYENACLTFENGILLSISATIKEEVPEYDDDYNVIGTTIETSDDYFEFVDYDATNVTLENTLPITQAEWEEVFATENCNNITIVVNFSVGETPYTENWYIDNGKEKVTVNGFSTIELYCVNSTWYTYYVDSATFKQTDVFDAEYPFVTGCDIFKNLFSAMKDMYLFMSYDEGEGVYYFDDSGFSYKLTLEDGKITTLAFTIDIEGQTSVYYYTISNYGTTSFTVPFELA